MQTNLAFLKFQLLGLSLTLACLPQISAIAQDPDLASQVKGVLEKNCASCHLDSDDGGIDYITNLQQLLERKKITPNDLNRSRIWIRINDADDPMPPKGETPRPSPAEIDLIKKYIEGLDAAPPSTPPTQSSDGNSDSKELAEGPRTQKISSRDVIAAIHDYLSKMDPLDRRFQRFFTLDHLYNLPTEKQNPRGVNNSFLDLVRAGTSKSINSLTWSPSIVTPKMFGPERTVLVLDTRDVEWDRNQKLGRPDLWEIIVQEYPYALKHDLYPDQLASQSMAKEIYQWTGADIPWVRADWFIGTATQPHIYHALLYDAVQESVRMRSPQKVVHADGIERIEQPMNSSDLYDWLKVDVEGNLRRARAARAGFTRSGVSSQNRLIERHPALYGYVWPSYDFKKGGKRMNLNAQPLGPDGVFPPELNRFSFEHDGGEMIFGLPNGLHGFLLVDGKGNRIPFGPPDVVFDKTKTTGNGMIVNGLSCISCHKNGLIEDFTDEIRFGANGFPASVRSTVRKLFLDRPDLDVLIKKDQARYRAAAIEAIAPYLTEEKMAAIHAGGNLVEPIDPVAKRFLGQTMDAMTLAAELGIPEEELKAAIKFNESLQKLGLTVVANGGTINRETWQSGDGFSIFQKTAQILKTGSPTSVQPPPWRGR